MDGLAGGRIELDEARAAAKGDTSGGRNIGDRELFYALLNIDEHYDMTATARAVAEAALDRACEETPPAGLALPAPADAPGSSWLEAARAWRGELGRVVAAQVGDLTAEQSAALLRQMAPSAVTDGCWSQYVSDAACSHTPVTALLLRPLVARVGAGDPAGHVGNAYLDLLRGLGQGLPESTGWAFAQEPGLVDAAFSAPVLRLAVSLFPQRFLPEIVGVDLFEAVRGTSPVIEALEGFALAHGAGPRYFKLRRAVDAATDPAGAAVAAIGHVLAPYEGGAREACWARVRAGFAAAWAADADEREALLAWARGPALSPRAKMLTLVRRRAESALGYHGRGVMQGRSLDAWFADAGRDPEAFVDALAASPYVAPGDPAGSPLLTSLVGTRGPMSGIFTRAELDVLTRWVETLPDSPRADGWAAPATAMHAVVEPPPSREAEYVALPIRELYFRMLHPDDFPEAAGFARKFAAGWLTRAGRIRPGDPKPPPFDTYSHAALEAWLRAQHETQLAGYAAATEAPPITREALIESSLQLCPTILIDGAWLQRFSGVAVAGTDVGAKLLRIYLDEVGDGSTVENHPNVYRELMASMDVTMPEFGTRAFAQWGRFQDKSFELPTFWLCVSRFPKQFLPEILGLNLAIELSGVGGTYRTTSHALRHYGFDSLFVDLHNTVDNVSTGHTAIALDAVKSHLDDMLARGGRAEVQRRWVRVWTGFRALAAGG